MLLQGNTYLLPIQVLDSKGNIITADRVEKGEFTLGDISKMYEENGDVLFNEEVKAFILPLTEEETFKLSGNILYQGRLLLKDGSVSGSVPKYDYVHKSISTTILSEGTTGFENGELLQIKLLKEIYNGGSGSGGIVEETDPTVPEFVKRITEGDISNWNNKSDFSGNYNDLANKPEGLATTEYVDKKVADLVNSAPETLDTLGEVAEAIEENADIVEALNSAIGNKVSKAGDTMTGSLRVNSGDITGSSVSKELVVSSYDNPFNDSEPVNTYNVEGLKKGVATNVVVNYTGRWETEFSGVENGTLPFTFTARSNSMSCGFTIVLIADGVVTITSEEPDMAVDVDMNITFSQGGTCDISTGSLGAKEVFITEDPTEDNHAVRKSYLKKAFNSAFTLTQLEDGSYSLDIDAEV